MLSNNVFYRHSRRLCYPPSHVLLDKRWNTSGQSWENHEACEPTPGSMVPTMSRDRSNVVACLTTRCPFWFWDAGMAFKFNGTPSGCGSK